MAGYWLKLYTEILEDPKYHKLSDNGKLGMLELMVVAKKCDKDGDLPSMDDICFYTRRNIEWWIPVIQELKSIQFLVDNGEGKKVRKFHDRQMKVSDNERQQSYREKKQRQEYSSNDPVTNMSRNVTNLSQNVTENRVDIDIDIDKNREEKKQSDSSSSNLLSPSKDQKKAWIMALGDMRREIPKSQYDTWLAPLELVTVTDNVFTIRAVNSYGADLIKSRYAPTLNGCIQGHYGSPTKVEVTV